MLASHLKLALKVLLRRRFFTAISLFGVALTLSVLLVATALLDLVFAPLAPEVHQDRTLLLFMAHLRGPEFESTGWPGYALLDRHGRDLPGLERLAIATRPSEAYSYPGGRRLSAWQRFTDAEYFRVLAFEFLEGGPYLDDDVAQGRPLAVINESTRSRFFGAGPALGRELVLDGQALRVHGVVRDVPIVRVAPFSDVWVPLSLKRGDGWREELRGEFMGIFLARSAAEIPVLQAEFKARLARAELPDRRFTEVRAVPESSLDAWARSFFDGSPDQESSGGRLLALLLGLAFAFMLLPALNLANLNAGRALERVSEIGLRKAFGASRFALVLQFVLENVVLCLLGGVLAVVFASFALRAVEAAELVPYARFSLSLRTLGVGLLFTLAFGLLSGIYPAWRLARLHPAEALRGGTR